MAEEAAAALDATDKDVSIGGAGLAAAAIELGLVDELRMFRNPVVVGGGTPFLPPVTENVRLELVETRTFGSRVIYERYGRARESRTDTAVRVISASRRRGLEVTDQTVQNRSNQHDLETAHRGVDPAHLGRWCSVAPSRA